MSASMWHESFFGIGGTVHWGIMGYADPIPAEHQLDTVIYYGGKGINKVQITIVLHWIKHSIMYWYIPTKILDLMMK